jgi:hypothetical protein
VFRKKKTTTEEGALHGGPVRDSVPGLVCQPVFLFPGFSVRNEGYHLCFFLRTKIYSDFFDLSTPPIRNLLVETS